VFLAGQGQERRIPIQPDDRSQWTDRASNVRRDRAGPAAGIENGDAGPQQRSEARMVAVQRPAAQDAGIGAVGLPAQWTSNSVQPGSVAGRLFRKTILRVLGNGRFDDRARL
jgi:hypothetical protein